MPKEHDHLRKGNWIKTKVHFLSFIVHFNQIKTKSYHDREHPFLPHLNKNIFNLVIFFSSFSPAHCPTPYSVLENLPTEFLLYLQFLLRFSLKYFFNHRRNPPTYRSYLIWENKINIKEVILSRNILIFLTFLFLAVFSLVRKQCLTIPFIISSKTEEIEYQCQFFLLFVKIFTVLWLTLLIWFSLQCNISCFKWVVISTCCHVQYTLLLNCWFYI